MRFPRLTLTVKLLLLLAACSSAYRPSQRITFPEMKKIGVISVAADEFYRHYTGYTVAASESEKMDISEWRVDEEYELQMQRALSALGRFEVMRVRYKRSDLVEMYRAGGMINLDPDVSRSKLREIASANDVDGILVFSRRDSRDFLAGTNQLLHGAGFYTNGATGGNRVSVVHLIGSVALVDGKTGNRVATKVLARSQQGRAGAVTDPAPMLIVAPDLTRLKLSELGDARLADIRRWLVALPSDSWGPTIRALFDDGAD